LLKNVDRRILQKLKMKILGQRKQNE